MTLEKREMLIPMSSVNRSGLALKPTSVTIHNTANRDRGAGAINHARFLVNRKEIAGWHWVVDSELAVLCIPENEQAGHTGSVAGNTTSLGVEICENNVGADGRLDAATYRNAVLLTADICRRHGWPANPLFIRTHRSWINRGECPRLLQGARWDKFIADVALELSPPTQHKVQPGDTYGRISGMYGVSIANLRKWNGWADTQIPVGAMMWLVEPPKAEPTVKELQAEVARLQKVIADKDHVIASKEKLIQEGQSVLNAIRELAGRELK